MQNNQTPTETPLVALDPQVEFSPREIGGRTMMVARHQATGKFFQFGPEEYRVAKRLEKPVTVAQLSEQLLKDGLNWDEAKVAEFVSHLVAAKLVNRAGETTPPAAAQASQVPWSQRTSRMLSLLVSQRFPLFDGDKLAAKLERRLGVLFSLRGILVWCVLVLSGLVIVSSHRHEFTSELRRLFEPGIWFPLLVMWVIAKVIHECGHAIAARYHDVRVGKMGVMFFFCAPLAYVDVTDAWKLKERWSRVQIALGGVYFELAIAAVAAWVWWLLPEGLPKHLCAQLCLITGPATLLVNANPLLRLDGYYVMSDLAEIPNLRMHGRRQLGGLIERLLLKIDPPKSLLTGWRRSFATVHGFCSVIFQVVWMGGLIVGVAIWAEGLGILLALVAFILWVVMPMLRWTHKVWTSQPAERWGLNDRRKRLISYVALVLCVVQYFGSTSSPFARRVPVVVQFCDQQIARAPVDAFITQVHVMRGQRVMKGMLLVELDAPDLLLKRDRKADDLRLAELRVIQFRRQGDLSGAAAEAENAASLHRQLAELDEQVRGLQVTATREGLVLHPHGDSLIGRFVTKGAEVMRVCDPHQKELRASVSESDMQAYQSVVASELPTTVRLRGGATLEAFPSRLRPRASRSLPHPALAASVGGPLAVEPSPDDDEEMRVTQPQLESITRLDPITSVEVEAGQIGMMTIADNRSLITRLVEAIQR
jgi:putative peptide zinc metalloprotease protein